MPFKDKMKDVDYFMKQMGHTITSTLNEEQEKHIRILLAKAIRIPSKKIIDLNVPFWFIKKYFMQFYLGEDKRKKNRNAKMKQTSENIIMRDYKYFYSLLPKDVAASLNFEQKRAVQDILRRCIVIPTKKIYETNKTFRLFGKDLYISFFLGYDKRKLHRIGTGPNVRGLSLSIRGFIYLLEIAVAVLIVWGLYSFVASLVGTEKMISDTVDQIDAGNVDIEEVKKIGEDFGYFIRTPLQHLDYIWWNYLKPFF